MNRFCIASRFHFGYLKKLSYTEKNISKLRTMALSFQVLVFSMLETGLATVDYHKVGPFSFKTECLNSNYF